MNRLLRWTTWSLLLLIVSFCAASLAAAEKKRLLIVGQGPDGHPPGTHEYMAGVRVLAKCLEGDDRLEIVISKGDGAWPEGPELLKSADGAVLYLSEGAKWIHADPRRLEAFAQLAARSGGLVALHWAIGTKEARYIDGFLKLLGGCHGGPDRKYALLETDVRVADTKHPITAGVSDFRIRDEFYYRLKFADAQQSITSILKAVIDGQPETVAWAWERPDGGRSFGFSGLHFHDNWRRVEYRRIAAQGVLWTLHLPIPEGGLPVKVTEEDLRLDAGK